jgi:hypothetical protein
MPKYLYIPFKKKTNIVTLQGHFYLLIQAVLMHTASQQWRFGPLLTLDPFLKIFNFDY